MFTLRLLRQLALMGLSVSVAVALAEPSARAEDQTPAVVSPARYQVAYDLTGNPRQIETFRTQEEADARTRWLLASPDVSHLTSADPQAADEPPTDAAAPAVQPTSPPPITLQISVTWTAPADDYTDEGEQVDTSQSQ